MKHKRYRSKLLASSLLTISYTDEDTPSLISDVLTRKIPTMYCEKYMKESTINTREQGLWQEKHLEQVITSQHYRRTHITSSEHATNANALRMSKRANDVDNCTLTFCLMGDRHNSTTPYRKEAVQVPHLHNRLLHKMGGS